MSQKNADDITFQVTVGQLTVTSQLAQQDIRVTVTVGDVSKITCSGELSEDGLIVKWNHPFLFSAPSFANVEVAICILPEELDLEWDKKPLGEQMVASVASLLGSENAWECNAHGLSVDPASFSMECKTSDVLIPPDGHDCLSALTEYDMVLYQFGRKHRNVPCVSTQIELGWARLDLCPPGHTSYTDILNDLSYSFDTRYNQDGNIADLNRAIELSQTILDLSPFGHPGHTKALAELALSLARHYYIQKNEQDLNKLMEMQQEWLDLCPPGHSDHTRVLEELALSLWECYNVRGDIADLNRAIEMGEEGLSLSLADNSGQDYAFQNLALFIGARYDKLGHLADLNRTIELEEQCLELRPLGHPYHGLALLQLAMSFHSRHSQMGDSSDLFMAITLLKEALESSPVQHGHYAAIAHQLAITTLLLANSPQKPQSPDQQLPSLDEAFEAYRLLKGCGPAASMSLLGAAKAWVKDAEKHGHHSVLEAYQTSLNTLDHFTLLTSSLDSRHGAMQTRVAYLANNAFSCAIRHNNFQMAVELLEQGRGILWNQLARFDTSLAALETRGDQGRELGRQFARLSADLRKHAQRSGSQDTGPYWRVQEQWRRVVDQIRNLDGFSRFLLPPCFDDLQQAAECGPVIIVNASKYGCDALIVLCARAPVHVSLPCSLDDVVQLCLQLSELTQDAHAYGTNRESYVKQVLRELWSSVVEPITSVLQKDVQLPLGSRIWWCPTSKFTLLPLHAAGPYRKGQKNLMDTYISSYAPSFSALLRARGRLRSQMVARHASGSPDVISFAAVGQAHPSEDILNLGELPEVEHEIQRIRDKTHMPPEVTFETIMGTAASIEGAVQAFRDHRWVHVACHGAQHAKRPFESWFAMGDGKLTLMRIIQERYTNSEFAFLSACHTALGDASTLDEVLHLAAGMQFAGFNGVIGTLWRVDDAVAHQMVTRFYKAMFGYPVVDFEHAAAALNTAALESTDDVSLEKRIVFVHIGI